MQRETNLAQGREEERPWCRLTQALVVQKLDNYTQQFPWIIIRCLVIYPEDSAI